MAKLEKDKELFDPVDENESLQGMNTFYAPALSVEPFLGCRFDKLLLVVFLGMTIFFFAMSSEFIRLSLGSLTSRSLSVLK